MSSVHTPPAGRPSEPIRWAWVGGGVLMAYLGGWLGELSQRRRLHHRPALRH